MKLTDFGLARAAEDVKLTRTGLRGRVAALHGPGTSARRRSRPRAPTSSASVRVLYEASTGAAPFEAKTPLAVLAPRVRRNANAADAAQPDVPKWLSDAVDKLLAKEPEGRYQTAAEVAEVFAAGLVEMHQLSPLDVPAEVCPVSSRSSVASRERADLLESSRLPHAAVGGWNRSRRPRCWLALHVVG